jgi:filamentous hemagglutinin family protein
MNRNFRSLWNDTTGTYVAVSENTKSQGKKTMSNPLAAVVGERLALKTISVCIALCFGVAATAGPVGGVVAAGTASINTGATNTTINQSSQNAVINWQSFNIAAGQTVQFVQPNSTSVALNRVLGSDPTAIFGSLLANGNVFLVNPNGVLFGKGAQVNVGGLVASTLNLSDRDFMSGNYRFSGEGQGAVLNQGAIQADGGYVALLGANVGNEGVIRAQLGTVALAAGNAITLDVAGDGLLNVAVSQGAVNALVQNGGLIRADGGQVLLTAQAASGLLRSAVNNTGIIEAQTLQNHKGTILLMGDMQTGSVGVGGTLNVSAPNGGDGGFIETSAAYVNVAPNAFITAESATGKTGTWLIDPKDFTVAAGGDITGAALGTSLATANVSILSNSGTAGVDGDVNVNEAVTWTAPTTLTLTALRDVNVGAAVTGTNGSLVANAVRDINVTAATKTTTGSLTLTAGNNVNVAAATTIVTGNLTAVAGQNVNVSAASTVTTGNIVLRADNDGTGPGAGTGGTVAITCGNNCLTITTGTLDIRFNPASYSTTAAEQLAYGAHLTGGGALVAKAWVFGKGNDKVYDGTTAATVTSFKPDVTNAPPPVSLNDATNAKFDTKDVGQNKPITYNSGFTNANFDLFAPFGTAAGTYLTRAAITPAPLSILANNLTKVYGETATLAPTAFTTPVAPVNGETVGSVTLISAGTVATAAVASSPYAIVPSNATGGTFTASNYTITYLNGTLGVTPAPLIVTASNATKLYGEAPTLSAFTTSALKNGETVGSVTLSSPGVVATAAVAGSPYVITPSDATGGTFTPSNYAISYVNGVLTVMPVPLVIKANDASKPYGTVITLPVTAFTSTGLKNGDTVTSVIETSPGTVAPAPVAGSPYAITPSGATGSFVPSNYIISYVNGLLTVTPVPLVITANDASKPFGTVITLPTTAFTSTGLVNGDTVTSVIETSPGTVAPAPVAGSPYVITPSGAVGSFVPTNYIVTYVNGKLTVTPVPLVITANDASKPFGTDITLPGTAFTSTGLVNGDTVISVTETSPGTVATAAVEGSPYVITPSGATGTLVPTNYTITYVNGLLTVTPLVVIPPVVVPPVVPPVVVPPVVPPVVVPPVVPPVVVPPVVPPVVVPPVVPPVVVPPVVPPVVVPPVVVPPVVPPVVVPPVVPPVVVPPVVPPVEVPPEVLVEWPVVPPQLVPPVWPPTVVPPNLPPPLLVLTPPVAPPVVVVAPPVAPPFVPQVTPVQVAPVPVPPAPPYVAPVRPRKQDRN